jgi:hypothetical protein
MQHIDNGERLQLAVALFPLLQEVSDLQGAELLTAATALITQLEPTINMIIDRRG